MQTKTKLLSLLPLIVLVAIPLLTVNAQPSLSLYKDNGYGLGNDIAGIWTANAQVSTDVSYVEFYLDDQLQQKDTSAPFGWQFDTSNYTIGEHTIKAVAYDNQGSSQTVQLARNFVENNTTSVIVIVIVVVAAVFAVLVGIAVYKIKKSKK
jgi:hypothetical protein